MKILSIRSQYRKAKVYDIETPTHDYILRNGLISHNTMELYSKVVIPGGTAVTYAANQIFVITKAQEKDGNDFVGWNFTININKSRYVKEKAKFPFLVTYKDGISKWSGLMDIALASGHVIKPSNGWYQRVDMVTGEVEEKKYRMADTASAAFWNPVLECKKFDEFIEKRYCMNSAALMDEDASEDVYATLEED